MRDCPSGDFYTVGPNSLPVKKCDTSQEWQGRAGSSGCDPLPRHLLPEWYSTCVEDNLVKKEENQKQIVAMKENQPTHPQAATQTPKSDVRTVGKQSYLETTHLPTANKHYRGWLIPITINH